MFLNANMNLVDAILVEFARYDDMFADETYFALICDDICVNSESRLHIDFFDAIHEFTHSQDVGMSRIRSEEGDNRDKFGSLVAVCRTIEGAL